MRRLLDDKKIALKTEGPPSKRATRIIRPEAPADDLLNAPNTTTKEVDR
jgi:hypothetical protein